MSGVLVIGWLYKDARDYVDRRRGPGSDLDDKTRCMSLGRLLLGEGLGDPDRVIVLSDCEIHVRWEEARARLDELDAPCEVVT